MKTTLIDLEPMFRTAKSKPDPSLEVAVFKEREIMPRILSGEHLHLQAFGLIECVNPNEKCWEGPRSING